jgi:hypothetical protein
MLVGAMIEVHRDLGPACESAYETRRWSLLLPPLLLPSLSSL